MSGQAVDVLDEYFDSMRSHDWARLAECLAPDIRRTGPYLDVVEGRAAYVEFLAGVIPTLPNYALSISSIHSFDRTSAVVKLTETLDVRGVSTNFPEVILFDFDDAGRIATVDIYIKHVSKVETEPGR